jgi:hypothetical protein
MQLVRAGLGEDLDTAKSGPVILGRKWILVDANLADA